MSDFFSSKLWIRMKLSQLDKNLYSRLRITNKNENENHTNNFLISNKEQGSLLDDLFQNQSSECSTIKGVLKNFTKFTWKQLRQTSDLQIYKKRLWHRCFPFNFAKFLRAPFFTEHLGTIASTFSYRFNTLYFPIPTSLRCSYLFQCFLVFYSFCSRLLRNHSFSAYAKFTKKTNISYILTL